MDPGTLPSAWRGTALPDVSYAIGSGVLKGEDVIVTHQSRVWPGSDFSNLPIELAVPPPPATAAAAAAGLLDIDSAANGAGAGPPRAEDVTEALGMPPPANYSLWCVFDGHNGVAAASMAAEHVTEIVEELLPYGPPEPPDSPFYQEWCEEVQRTLGETIAALNLLFAGRGILAGCTATLVLQVGWLVTCANVGDSRALIDTGSETLMLTVDHRVATHKAERRRVEAMGATIAPIDFTGSGPASNVNNGVGPLRIWPGGLCLSRAVGDFDVGESVIPLPHICQVILPPTGARLMVGSDGVWDAFDKMTKVGTMSRSWTLDTCADRMVQTIVRTYGGLRDDTSLIVVDITPPGKSFLDVVQSLGRKGQSSKAALSAVSGAAAATAAGGAPRSAPKRQRSGGCLCFGGSAVVEDDDPRALAPTTPLPLTDCSPNPSVSHRCRLTVVANYDVAEVMGLMPDRRVDAPGWYSPEVGERLFRMMKESMTVWKEAARMNGGSRHGPSPNPSLHRGNLVAAMLAGSGAVVEESGGGGLRRAPSMFFTDNVAAEEDYGTRFGHYSTEQGATRPAPGSDSSVRGGRMSDSSVRSGRLWMDPSVRAGRAYFDPSVRAGRAYFEPSVRAGRAYMEQSGSLQGLDPSVRAGGDDSVRAGAPPSGGALPPAPAQQGSPQGPAASPFVAPSAQQQQHSSLEGRPRLADSAQEESGSRRASLSQTDEEAMGLAPIRTVRFGSVESLGGQRSSKAMPVAAALAAAKAAAPPELLSSSGALQAGGSGAKAVRFVLQEQSPVDHFTGLSHTSSALSSVDEDRAG